MKWHLVTDDNVEKHPEFSINNCISAVHSDAEHTCNTSICSLFGPIVAKNAYIELKHVKNWR